MGFDRFDVAKHLNEAVDKVRRTEHRKLQEEGEETLAGSKFLFLFAPENLDSERGARLRGLLNGDLRRRFTAALRSRFDIAFKREMKRVIQDGFNRVESSISGDAVLCVITPREQMIRTNAILGILARPL
ncbi:MAG TPA: transposase [Terrimicrobiaceae bacterium]